MAYLIISCSLNPESRSRVLARAAQARLEEHGADAEFIDLRDFPLPFCDGGPAYGNTNVRTLSQRIAEADGLLVACPIYNYNISSSLKNLIELTGDAWRDKVVAIVCAAGGYGSYMAHMGIVNSLMLDYRCVIVPRFVHSGEFDVIGDRITSAETLTRLDETLTLFLRIARALIPVHESAKPSA